MFTNNLFIPKAMVNIGKRAFSEAAPTIGKQLLIKTISYETIATCRKETTRNILIKTALPPYIFGGSMLQRLNGKKRHRFRIIHLIEFLQTNNFHIYSIF